MAKQRQVQTQTQTPRANATQRVRTTYVQRKHSELLEGTTEDVIENVSKDITENPALEVDDTKDDVEAGYNTGDDGTLGDYDSIDVSGDEPDGEKGNLDDSLDGDLGDSRDDADDERSPLDSDPTSPNYDSYEGDTGDDPNDGPTGNGLDRAEDSLYEHLMAQFGETDFDERQRLIATHIVGNLDDRGFLAADPYDIAYDIFNLEYIDVTEDEVLEVLAVVQTFEPLGVGARNLQECLLIQLGQRNTQYTSLAVKMVAEHFGDFMNQRLDKLAKSMKVSEDEIRMVYKKEIHKLDPKPAGAYSVESESRMQQIMPTFEIKVEDGEISFEIPSYLPSLHVSQTYRDYYASIRDQRHPSDDVRKQREELLKNINKAESYIEALKMRQETLTRTMNAIIHIQRDYFLNFGDKQMLKPMKLRDLAALADRDESTLSRATSDKYMSTPWGTIPLKTLFAEGIAVAGGEVANKAIQDAIAELVQGEDKQKPLSDSAIADIVNKKLGCDIARRTVNKYRHALNIPSASTRKKQL